MYRYILLILYQTYADLRTEARRTYAGFLWWFVEPLLHMAVYYIVFAVLIQRSEADFVPFLLIGLVVWRWFHVSLMQGGMAISSNKRLMQQLYMPKVIFPSVSILSNAIKFGATLVMLLLFLWVYGLLPTVHYLALPILLAIQMLLIMGCTYVVASIMPLLPDLRIMLDNALRAVMFVSGVFFSGDIVPDALKPWFYANPMAVMLESYRDVLLHGQWPHWERLGWIVLVSMGAIVLGRKLLRHFDYSYPKVMM